MKILLLLLGLLVMAFPAPGCQVPVFRYALEHWPPEPYRAAVFYRGSLTASQNSALKRLSPFVDANLLKLSEIDTSVEPDAPWKKAWDAVAGQSLPRLVLLYPPALGTDELVWSAAVDDQAMTRLLSSPVREEIIRRLLAGHSAVWLFLPKGDPAIDQPARQQLEERLRELQDKLELPPDAADSATPPPEAQPLSNVPLKIEFSVLECPLADSRETVLMSCLGLMRREVPDGPVVIPVYGRGRALSILNRNDLTGKPLEETCRFLTGICSCQVKEENPGMDLFIPLRWDEILPAPAPLEALAAALRVPLAPPVVPAAAGPAPSAKPTASRLWLGLATVLAGLFLVVAVLTYRIIHRSRNGARKP